MSNAEKESIKNGPEEEEKEPGSKEPEVWACEHEECELVSWERFIRSAGVNAPPETVSVKPVEEVMIAFHRSIRHKDFESIDGIGRIDRTPIIDKILEALREGREIEQAAVQPQGNNYN